jgi:hypothetical protein
MPKSSIALALLLSIANSSAFADFYIVKDTVTNTCIVVENKPANGVNGVAYKSKAEAEKAMESVKGCAATASD